MKLIYLAEIVTEVSQGNIWKDDNVDEVCFFLHLICMYHILTSDIDL